MRPVARLALVALAAALCLGTADASAALPTLELRVPGAVPEKRKATARLHAPGYAGLVGIEQRGHSSGRFPKRSYGFETRDAAGKARNVALLGLPKENDWILYAAYNDKTLMRNVLAAETARRLGRYASRARFVELVLNGSYRGVYVLMERPKLDKRRVAVDDRDVTGGYLLQLTSGDKLDRGEAVFRLPVTRKPVEHADPDYEDLKLKQRRWIRGYVGTCERRLYGPLFRNRDRGWRSCLDEGAAVDYILVNELFKNQDAFQSSTYLSKSAGAPLRLGPVWDFDVSAGNSNYGGSRHVTGWMLADRRWAARLYDDPAFVQALAVRWRALRAQGLGPWLAGRIDAHARTLRGPAARNFARWPVLGRYVWPNPVDPATGRYRPTFAAEVAHLRTWLAARAAWIDEHIERR